MTTDTDTSALRSYEWYRERFIETVRAALDKQAHDFLMHGADNAPTPEALHLVYRETLADMIRAVRDLPHWQARAAARRQE